MSYVPPVPLVPIILVLTSALQLPRVVDKVAVSSNR